MGIDYTVDALINKVKTRGTIPTSQALYLPADFVDIMSDVMHDTVVPAIVSVREEYFVTYQDQDIVANQANYRIVSRAVGGMLRDIVLVNSAGTEISLPRLDPESQKSSPSFVSQSPYGFKLRGDEIILIPTPSAANGDSIRQYYERRPNNLILQSAAARIQSFTALTRQIVIDATPSNFSASDDYDIIRPEPLFASVGDDLAASGLSGTTLTMSAALPSGIAADQWIAEAGFSPVPQIPYEAGLWLVHEALCAVMEGMESQTGLENARKKADRLKDNFMKIITPRVHGSPQKVVARGSIFDYSRVGGRWRR